MISIVHLIFQTIEKLVHWVASFHCSEYKLAVHTLQNAKIFKVSASIIPEKQQKCKPKYFVPCTKVSSHNNNILQKHIISWNYLTLQPLCQANFLAVYLTSFMFNVLNFLYFSLTLFYITFEITAKCSRVK